MRLPSGPSLCLEPDPCEETKRLEPTTELLASPPIRTIAAGASQVMRLVLRRPAKGREASYRILLDQIPPPAAPGTVRIALRLSIPIFVEPLERAAPHLQWRVEASLGQAELVAVNDGNRREKVLDMPSSPPAGRHGRGRCFPVYSRRRYPSMAHPQAKPAASARYDDALDRADRCRRNRSAGRGGCRAITGQAPQLCGLSPQRSSLLPSPSPPATLGPIRRCCWRWWSTVSPVGKIGEFVQRDSELLASPAELRDLGIRVPDRVPSNQGDLVPLSTIEGLSVRLDMATQTLYVTAAPERLLPELLLAPGVSGANVRVESGSARRSITMSSAPRWAGKTLAAGCSICVPSRLGAWFPRACSAIPERTRATPARIQRYG